MKKILILPLFSLLVVVLSLLPHEAHATTDELKDQPSCQSIGGTWTSNNSTCTITSSLTTFDTWQIDKGVTLQINSGIHLLVETTTTGSANYGIYNNGGTINNYGNVVVSGTYLTAIYNNVGIINNYGYMDAAAAYSGGTGIKNTGTNTVFGTINNAGTMIGDSGFFGIDNTPGNTINNAGTMAGTGYLDGIVSGGIINNAGAMSGISTAPSGTNNYGIGNSGTINDYCGVTPSGSYNGNAPNNISCYNVSFNQTGIQASGVTWGVTASWGPFISFDNTGTGTGITLQATGPLTYSYDTPISSSGTSYGCGSECSGSATITGATTFTANYVVVVPTSTSVSCSPLSVSVGSPSTCTATVTGNSPTGTVTFSTSTGDTSQFSSTTCSLSSGSCQVTYTPSSSTSPVAITGSYGGDFGNLPSSNTSSLTVTESATTTTVSCSPTTGAGSPSTCTATVTGNSPTGTVTFSTSTGDTSQFSSTTCSLSSGSCQVTYTPSSSTSPVAITGSYGGDSNNVPSSGTFLLTIGIVITTLNGATVCPVAPLSGTWSGDTCTVSGTVNIPSGMNLDIGSGVTISISSSSFAILTSGNINNNGTVTGSSGTSDSGISNFGTINNYGTMTGSSSSSNGIFNSGGTINNYGTMTGSSSSSNGIVNSRGTINNTGKMSGTGGNAGIEFVSGTVNNNGTLSGTGGTFGFLNGATIDNAGSITGSGSSFAIYNGIGTIKNSCGGTITGKISGNPPVNTCSTPPTLTLNPTSGSPGTQVALSGSGWDANALVEIDLVESSETVLADTTTDGSGHLATTVTIPAVATAPFQATISVHEIAIPSVIASTPFSVIVPIVTPPITASPEPTSATEGEPLSNAAVAHFTDGDPTAVASDFTATINWGDSTTSTGTIASNPSGGFDVSGSHTYASSGSYTLSITINDNDGTSATVTGTVPVVDAPLTATSSNISPVNGVSFTGIVTHFTDANPTAVASDFTATINWGDGSSPTSGVIASNPSGGFDVSGSHTYSSSGSETLSITIHDAGGSSATATATATVVGAPLIATATNISSEEGNLFTGMLAHFTDADPGVVASDYAVTINWGDGSSPTSGVIASNPSGGFDVSGTHTYAEEGTYTLSITINDNDGTSAAVPGTATVADAPLTAAGGSTFTAITGTSTGNLMVATFTDANPTAVSSDFTATINWGDGNQTPATIASNPSGGFDVSGSHTYSSSGSETVAITINDHGSTASATDTITVIQVTKTTLTSSPNPSLLGQPVTFTAIVSPAPDGGIVTFYDGSTVLGTGKIDATGTATFTTSSLTAGLDFKTAAYSGDANFAASTSAVLSQTVEAATQANQNLINSINSMGLPNGTTSSLTATLKNIDLTSPSACGKLNAFITKVNSDLTDGSLTGAQASSLLSQANAIQAAIGCP
ncbi:MAG: beta strand repeat-containing protein [Nitrosotalea sp.]